MIGSTLSGRYKIVNVLGAGGMGRTYVAEDMLRPGHPKCVVKQLRPASTDPNVLDIARRLFATEAETLERLGNHDQIPRLLAYFEHEEEFYLVQEFIDGHPLSAELHQARRWSEPQVIQLLQEILAVLSFIHNQNVIHRDIKPDNIIRRSRDNKLVLIDFGAVKQVRMQQLTLMGQASVTVAIGTPGYMPTEQSTGKPRPSSDIYAVGMVGIQALTGVLPTFLHEDEDGEVIWRTLVEVHDGFAHVIDKMVRHYFKHRYQTAAEALQALYQLTVDPETNGGRATQVVIGGTGLPPISSPPTYPFATSPLPTSHAPTQSSTTAQPHPVETPTSEPRFPTPLPVPLSPSSVPVSQSNISQTPSTPPTQSVSPSIPANLSLPPGSSTTTAAQASLNHSIPATYYQSNTVDAGSNFSRTEGRPDLLTTPALSRQTAQSQLNGQAAPIEKSSAKWLWGGGIALLLLAGGAVYALFFADDRVPQPVPTVTTPARHPVLLLAQRLFLKPHPCLIPFLRLSPIQFLIPFPRPLLPQNRTFLRNLRRRLSQNRTTKKKLCLCRNPLRFRSRILRNSPRLLLLLRPPLPLIQFLMFPLLKCQIFRM
jgi:serine/threonine protein kinase